MREISVRRAIAAVLVAWVSISSAAAATVSVTSGTVSINTGAGWQPLPATAGPFDASQRTQVMAGKDSEGLIAYGDGCVDRVKPGMIKVIKLTSPCVGRSMNGAEEGAAAAAAAEAAGTGLSTGVIIGVGVAVAVGVAIAVSQAEDDDEDSPVSP